MSELMTLRLRPAAGRPARRVLHVVLLLAGILIVPCRSAAQAGAPLRQAEGSGRVPRLSDGHPDLQGVWNFGSATPLERPPQFANKPVLTDAEAAAFLEALPTGGCRFVTCDGSDTGRLESAYDDAWYEAGAKLAGNRTSLVVDPPDGRIPPLTPDGRQRAEATRALDRGRAFIDSPEGATASDRCLIGFNSGPPMNPSAYNNMVQIFQTATHVVIYNEMIHNARIVPLDGRPHLAAGIRQWTGDSRGRWEGDTLVVETINFRPDSGGMSTDPGNLRLTERITRTGADALTYEYTMDDAHTWTRPWTARIPMTKSSEHVFEYACHEGNYSMAHRLSAARANDRTNPK
jgi:hypothetical protein